MSEGKMELRELSDGRVLRFEPATGRTWQLTSWDRWELIEEPNQQEEEDDDSDEEDDGEHRSMWRVDVNARGWRRYHGPRCTTATCRCALGGHVVPALYSGYEHPSTEQYEGSSILKSAIRANLDPAMLPWRELLRMGAAPETTQGTIPTASPIPDTSGTVRFIWQRKAADDGEGEDEEERSDKPEPDYRSSAAWE